VTEAGSGDLPLAGNLEVVTAAADDFGHTVHKVPALVAFPADMSTVASIALYAHSHGIQLVPRGAGHSVYGQAQSDGGIVCDLTRLDAVTLEDAETISTEAGARWSRVLDAGLAHGLTPPVLTDYLELTVGGTLSAGGIGGASHAYGPVIDHVRELEVVTPAGKVVRCSANRNPDTFFGALGSGGSGGIITRARLPLVPAPEQVRVCQIAYPDVSALVADQLRLARERRLGYIEGQIELGEDGEWRFSAELGIFSRAGQSPGDPALEALSRRTTNIEDMSYRDFCYRMTPGVRLLAATGDWYQPHPWFSAFLPSGAVERYVNSALAELTLATVGPIPTLLYPLRRGSVPAPGLVTPAHDELFFAFSILRTTQADDALAEALTSNERLARDALAAGGTVYGISALPRKGSNPATPANPPHSGGRRTGGAEAGAGTRPARSK
jgi:FAD/FMN-containing dehydrogenase